MGGPAAFRRLHAVAPPASPPDPFDEIEAFVRHHVGLQGRVTGILGRHGPEGAHRLLEIGMAIVSQDG